MRYSKYKLDNDNEKIVKAIIHAETGRQKRKQSGTMTEFDIKTEQAIQAAVEHMELQGYEAAIRQQVIEKIIDSLRDNIPWELMGETYCCRSLFYDYRKQFCYLVAEYMGIISGKEYQN